MYTVKEEFRRNRKLSRKQETNKYPYENTWKGCEPDDS